MLYSLEWEVSSGRRQALDRTSVKVLSVYGYNAASGSLIEYFMAL